MLSVNNASGGFASMDQGGHGYRSYIALIADPSISRKLRAMISTVLTLEDLVDVNHVFLYY